jgi:hypothetical protein
MVQISSWLPKCAKLYLQYFCASLASVPAGLLAFGLIKAGLREPTSVSVAIVAGLALAAIIWRILNRYLFPEASVATQANIEITSFIWQIQGIGGGAYLAGTMAIITSVATPAPSVEYKSFSTTCRTGTATRIYAPSSQE